MENNENINKKRSKLLINISQTRKKNNQERR